MEIILLSGGSGRRLWPLSSPARSKQFIRLFKNNKGDYESMLQRVYRQITEVDGDAKVTIATSEEQVGMIRDQLGDKVDICVEPARRNTFPAIALAATFLHYEKGLPLDRAVAVCPVDHYVENSYYERVMELVALAGRSDANLSLMGIEPSYPSEKYGYIIPETNETISKVKEFKEKPATEAAREYLKEGALWNAGVFAFRLGYLIQQAKSLASFTDYKDLFAKYEALEKTSFDYAIVEKEPSIQVLRYAGDWKDIGTWNVMAQVMPEPAIGNVSLDEFCEDAHVVNELELPILCMGCKDMVVVASKDGILITDKERSGYVKPYVEKITAQALKMEAGKMKKALITGITGQDGSYLAELLLEKDYEVHGIVRRASSTNTERIEHILGVITLHDGDLTDSSSLIRIINIVKPDEVYNLAAQSHVGVSFDAPEYSGDVNALGVLRILEAVRMLGLEKTCRIYQASTSELYGQVMEAPQDENTPLRPFSPYAIAKLYGYWMIKEYRDAYGMFACNGILFNHESERRGDTFVTRKITRAAGRIACGLQDHLELGNLDSLRDWGYAKDYVECMWLMLQQEKPDDFVIATGEQHTVREFTTLAFSYVGIDLEWRGSGMEEMGYDKKTGKMLVCVNPEWFRPTDVVNLWGNPAKAKTVLGWNPQKTSYEELCRIMAEHDLELARKEPAAKQA